MLTYRFWLVAVVLPVVLCGGCAQKHSIDQVGARELEPVATGTTTGPAGTGLPALPPPVAGGEPHATAVANPLVKDGDDWLASAGDGNRPGEASPDGQVLLPGGEDDLAWAVYEAEVFSTSRPVSISFNATAAPLLPGGEDDLPLSYWIGLGNYSRLAWEWLGPFEDSTELTLNSAEVRERYVTPGTDPVMYFLVVVDCSEVEASEDNPEGLAAVEVITGSVPNLSVYSPDYFDTVPAYTELEDAGTGNGKGAAELAPIQHVTLAWSFQDDPYKDACEALYMRVYRRRNGQQARKAIGTVDATRETYTDPVDNSDPADHVIPGAEYDYWIEPGNSAGPAGLSNSVRVEVPLLPPADIEASDGTYADFVRVTWSSAEGATSYLVYRDGSAGPVAETGNVTAWDDTTLADFEPHTYRVKSFNQYAVSSAYSPADLGYRSTAPVADLEAPAGLTEGNIPLYIEFDAGSSYDPDDGPAPGSGIIRYDWDWDGDGTYDLIDGGSFVDYTYVVAGDYNATVRVTDDELETATDSILIVATMPVPSWHSEVIVLEEDVARDLAFPSLAYDELGNPAVSYLLDDGGGSGALNVTAYNGSGWVDMDPLAADGTCAVLDYLPGTDQLTAAYSPNDPASPLQLAREAAVGWDYEDVLDSLDYVAFASGVLADSSKVGVAFEKEELGLRKLYFAARNGSWATWLVDEDFDNISTTTANISTTFNLVTGYPVIAYTAFPDADLRVAAFDGVATWDIDIVADTGETGYYPAIAAAPGGPVGVAFMDWTSRSLMYAYHAGGGVWAVETVDTAGSPGYHCNSLAYDDTGHPVASYYAALDEELRVAWYDGSDWVIEVVDGPGAGYWSDLVSLGGGELGLAYYRQGASTTTAEIVYARYGLALY